MSSPSSEQELEALFDSISDARQRELRGARPPAGGAAAGGAAAGGAAAGCAAAEGAGEGDAPLTLGPGDWFTRIGNLARQLHEALCEVGADSILTKAAREMPDARDRLSYIARVTEQAAERVLAAVEVAQANHHELTASVDALAVRWERFFARELSLDGFCELARDTRMFMAHTQGKAGVMTAQLHEIMMAQDFQDLTGQVVQKLTQLVGDIESQLLRFLIEALPPAKQAEYSDELAGPAVNPQGRPDVVADQSQVDDLLESLGF